VLQHVQECPGDHNDDLGDINYLGSAPKRLRLRPFDRDNTGGDVAIHDDGSHAHPEEDTPRPSDNGTPARQHDPLQEDVAVPSETSAHIHPTSTTDSHHSIHLQHTILRDHHIQSTHTSEDLCHSLDWRKKLERSTCATRARCVQSHAVTEPSSGTENAQHVTAKGLDTLAPIGLASTLDAAQTRDPTEVLRDFHNLVADCMLGSFGDSQDFPQELKQFVQVQIPHYDRDG
jgi:hypothetical protein